MGTPWGGPRASTDARKVKVTPITPPRWAVVAVDGADPTTGRLGFGTRARAG